MPIQMILSMTVILLVFLMLIIRVVPLLRKLMDHIVCCCFSYNLFLNNWLQDSLWNHFLWLLAHTFIYRISFK